MLAIGRHDLAHDPTLVRNDGRVRTSEIDAAIQDWCSSQALIPGAFARAEMSSW